jgi:predicted alpha/beta-hydrolase family hydrolase
MRVSLPALLLSVVTVTACGTLDEPPVRMPAAITITHPADSAPEETIDADAEGVCRTWGRDAALVARYENESRDSRVSAYNCVQG